MAPNKPEKNKLKIYSLKEDLFVKTISKTTTRKIIGGSVAAVATVAGGACAAVGFINIGIDIGNWLFKNNCRKLFQN